MLNRETKGGVGQQIATLIVPLGKGGLFFIEKLKRRSGIFCCGQHRAVVRQSLLKGNVEKRLDLPSCEWGRRRQETTGRKSWEGVSGGRTKVRIQNME